MSDRSVSPTAAAPQQEVEWDVSKMTPQELKLYKLYGKLPSRNQLISKKLKDRKYFDSGDYAMSKVRNQQLEEQEITNSPPPKTPNSGSFSDSSSHHISVSSSPKKIPEDDFISSSVDESSLPLPNVEKIMSLQKKKSITRHGSVISTTNKEITGISSKSGLEMEVDSDDI